MYTLEYKVDGRTESVKGLTLEEANKKAEKLRKIYPSIAIDIKKQ